MPLVDRFLDWAHNALLESEDAQAYLRGRGASMEQWKAHRLGYVSGGFDADPSDDPGHNADCGDRDKKPLWCDTCRYVSWSSQWDSEEDGGPRVRIIGRRISGSVVFPLTSYSGVPVGFQVRSISQKSYDTFLIRRRPECYFFGTAAAVESIWSTREVFLVEGPGDDLVFERLVAPNVLALTTSAVNKLQLRFLRRFVDTVNLVLDRDQAGRDGTSTFIKYNGRDFKVRDVSYPCVVPDKDKDPGDYWKRVGDHKFSDFFRKKIATTF